MHTSIACASSALQAGAALRVIPAGAFRAYDGRPAEVVAWNLDADGARKIMADLATRQAPYVIDYEHQTLNKAQNGQPAPAAGWFDSVEWREGDGLYMKGIKWTAKASAMIEAREYRYLSPVMKYSEKNGNVVGLHSVALTNDPALVGLSDLAAASAQPQRFVALSALMPTEHDLALTLTDDEKRIAESTGLSAERFAKAKAEMRAALSGAQTHGLTEDEARIAAATGLSPEKYAKAKAS